MYINIISVLPILLLASRSSTASTAAQCEDISNALPDPTCWETLQITSYVVDWFESETPYKNASQNCYGVEAWADCFMRLTLNVSLDDTSISCTGSGRCPYPSTLNNQGLLQGPSRAKSWYVAYSIWYFHEYLMRTYTLFQQHQPRDGYGNIPTDELLKFFKSEAPWSANTAFETLKTRILGLMSHARRALYWTGFNATGIETGLLHVLRNELTDLETRGGNSLSVAEDGQLLGDWTCLYGLCASANPTGA